MLEYYICEKTNQSQGKHRTELAKTVSARLKAYLRLIFNCYFGRPSLCELETLYM